MKILMAHNYYRLPGGEDEVFRSESKLLKHFGEEVVLYERSNAEFDKLSNLEKLRHSFSLSYSQKTYKQIRALIKQCKPDVAHFHNIFFMISPSAYLACQEEGVPVVQTLHNFRLLCSNGLFYRQGMICEDCLKTKNLWRGVFHGCYKNSRMKTSMVVSLINQHWKQKTWFKMVDLYIALTEFGRRKFIEGGIPPEKIIVKPHFLVPQEKKESKDSSYALYIGRLSEEKGIDFLIRAWEQMGGIPLKVIGDGPLKKKMMAQAYEKQLHHIEFLGHRSQQECYDFLRGAKFVIIPSHCYETFSRVIMEAFSCRIPVIASRIGSLQEIIADGQTGILFSPSDLEDFRQKVHWLLNHPEAAIQISEKAYQCFKEKFAFEQNYKQLITIYKQATELARHCLKQRVISC